jgi:hypothetical protein
MNNKYIIYIVAIAIISYFVYVYVNKKPIEVTTEGGNEATDEAAKAAAAIAAEAAKIAAEKAAADAYASLNNPADTNVGNNYPLWQNKQYLTSEYVIYNNNLYKNTVQITTTNNTTPDKDNRWQKFIL